VAFFFRVSIAVFFADFIFFFALFSFFFLLLCLLTSFDPF
jgi:hypothetical protein